jgi:hypothetical protein
MTRLVLGMTSLNEQKYFEHYGASLYTGAGEIVDLGCWLGSTTIPLARGLVKNHQSKSKIGRIHAFDQFEWESWMEECVHGTKMEGRFVSGQSFLEEFRNRTKPWASFIHVHQEDLRSAIWKEGPIELLLVDSMKALDISKAILKGFFPHLIAGKSFLIHQDFAHYYTSWIHLIQYRLRDYFQFDYAVQNSCTVVFKCMQKLPDSVLDFPEELKDFSKQEIDQAFEYSLSLVSTKRTQANIAAAKVMLFLHLQDLKQAKEEFENFIALGLPRKGDLRIVGQILDGQPVNLSPGGDYANEYPGGPLNTKFARRIRKKVNRFYRLLSTRLKSRNVR